MLADCFTPAQLLKYLGAKALILLPLIVFGPLIAFFRSEFDSFVSQFNHDDKYTIAIKRSSGPTGCPTDAQVISATKRYLATRPYLPTDASKSIAKSPQDIQCSGIWAAAGIDIGYGETFNTYTAVMKYENGTWVWVVRDKPCANKQIPAAIYELACNSN